MLQWQRVPERLLIVGGGYIGGEFAAIFVALGSAVTLITKSARSLQRFDADAVATVHRNLQNDLVNGVRETTLKRGKNGALVVDQRFSTSVDGIFAIGDVADRLLLTPVATRDGHSLAQVLYGGGARQVDLAHVATAAFSLPPIAQIGQAWMLPPRQTMQEKP